MIRGTYRVWMKDGYASLQTAGSEIEARDLAITQALKNCHGCAMSPGERKAATTVDYVNTLSERVIAERAQ